MYIPSYELYLRCEKKCHTNYSQELVFYSARGLFTDCCRCFPLSVTGVTQ